MTRIWGTRSAQRVYVRLVRLDPIVIVPYDDRWPIAFERERARITPPLRAALHRPIEHMGSTSVPGLAAKPIDTACEYERLKRVLAAAHGANPDERAAYRTGKAAFISDVTAQALRATGQAPLQRFS